MNTMAPMCPHCGREAPIVYRGVLPHCTACGGLRVPLSSPSVNLAGKPSRVGGTVASVFGWLVLLIGGSFALGLALLFAAFQLLGVALALALPVAIVSLVVGLVLVRRGSSLSRSGLEAERSTREQALLALAAHRGPVTAAEAARVFNVSVEQADAMLTDLAKRQPDKVSVDVDDQGLVWYRVVDARVRVGVGLDGVGAGLGARVGAGVGAGVSEGVGASVGEVEDEGEGGDEAAEREDKKRAGV